MDCKHRASTNFPHVCYLAKHFNVHINWYKHEKVHLSHQGYKASSTFSFVPMSEDTPLPKQNTNIHQENVRSPRLQVLT